MNASHKADDHAPNSLEWLRQQNSDVRREALEKLKDRGDDAAIALLVACLADDNPGVQQKAIDGLIQIGGVPVLRQMAGLLRELAHIQNMAVEIIEQVVQESVECLRPAIESSDPNVRKLVVNALCRQPDPKCGTWLLSMLAIRMPTFTPRWLKHSAIYASAKRFRG